MAKTRFPKPVSVDPHEHKRLEVIVVEMLKDRAGKWAWDTTSTKDTLTVEFTREDGDATALATLTTKALDAKNSPVVTTLPDGGCKLAFAIDDLVYFKS